MIIAKVHHKYDNGQNKILIYSLDEVKNILDDIKEAAECQSLDSKWLISLEEMTETEFLNLKEFNGF